MSIENRPKVGVLLYSNNGLRRSGAGTPDGTYEERMKRPESLTLEALGAFAETVSAGAAVGKRWPFRRKTSTSPSPQGM